MIFQLIFGIEAFNTRCKFLKMNRQQHFRASSHFRGLEEAVNTIIEDNDDVLEYDLVIIPPEPSVLTDEEEVFDDNKTSTILPNDVSGEVEVFVHNLSTLSDSDSSSDNEPLSAKRARIRTNLPRRTEQSKAPNRSPLNVPSWRKCAPNYSKNYMESDDQLLNENCMKEAVKNFTPAQIFEKFFDDEVLSMIVDFTQTYATQNNQHNFSVTSAELKTFFGILILSGYHKLPREGMYWCLDVQEQV